MKLLIVTQVVDLDHPVLGFFHRWIEELAKRVEHIDVVALFEGRHKLPENVCIHSLGKERGGGGRLLNRVKYSVRFLRLVWKLRRDYDAAFVHMNQEYVLLAGLLWKLLGKRIYMWRNHYAGSWLTDVAAHLCTKVFCTSRHSYTAKYGKTVFMPVGVDTERFYEDTNIPRKKNSILFLGRMSPSKNPLMLLEALKELKEQDISFTASFVGSPLPEHEPYYRSLVDRAKHYGLEERVSFLPGVPNHETPNLYRGHEIFVNCSPPGMFDKTIFEAGACGCSVLAISSDYLELAGKEWSFASNSELTERLKVLIEGNATQDIDIQQQSISKLGEQLVTIISVTPSRNISFLINDLGYGGAERVFINDANAFIADGYSVKFFLLYGVNANLAKQLNLDPRVQLILLKARNPFDIKAVYRFVKEVKGIGPSALVSTLNDSNIFARWVALWVGRRRLHLTIREANTSRRPSKSWWQRLLDLFLFWIPDHIIVVSHEGWRSLGWPLSRKATVLQNAITVPKNIKEKKGDETQVLTVGRLVEQKDHATLIEALAILAEEGIKIRVVIIGHGSLHSKLVELIHTRNLERVVSILGTLSHEEVLDHMKNTDLFVLTSRWEGSPNVLLEAMAAGLPVIATAVGGIPDLITHKQHGLLVPPGNPRAVADTLRLLIQDRKLRELLGTAALTRAKDFSPEERFIQLRAIVTRT